jgi:hypothetical protein
MKIEWKIVIFYTIGLAFLFIIELYNMEPIDSLLIHHFILFNFVFFILLFVYSIFNYDFKWISVSSILKITIITVFAFLLLLNMNGFFVQKEIERIKEATISGMLSSHQQFIERVERARGKRPDEIKAYIESLKPLFQKEKEKFYYYCDGKNTTPYCQVMFNNIKEVDITYHYDKESFDFFNQPKHIYNDKYTDYLTSAESGINCIDGKKINIGTSKMNSNKSENFYSIVDKGFNAIAFCDGEDNGGQRGGGRNYQADCANPIPKENIVEIAPHTYIQKQH